MLFFNVMKLIFIHKKFNMLPINASYLKVVALSLILLFTCWMLPLTFIGKFAFIMRCFLYSFSLVGILLLTDWVSELNINVRKIVNRFKS